MKNKLFLKAEPDTNPDMVSPHQQAPTPAQSVHKPAFHASINLMFL